LRIQFPSGALWQHAGFMRLWTAQTVSSFGARIAREGFGMAAILSIHARPSQLGILAALIQAPSVLVGLFGGGFVDRSRRRSIMIGSDLFRTAMLLTIPVAAWLHLLGMVQLYAIAALVGTASVFFDIADHAYLPSLIDRSLLLDGNTKLGVTESIAEIGGPALAGALFQLFTAPIAMLGTAVTYLLSAIFLVTIPVQETLPAPGKQRPRWHHDLRDGLAAIMAQPLVRPLFAMAVVSPLFGAFFSALYSLYALRVLGFTPAILGVVIATGGVGSLFGAGLAAVMARRFGVGPTIIVCGFASVLLALLIPLANGPMGFRIGLMMVSQFGGDAFGVAIIILATSLRQSVLPPELLGRTAGIFRGLGGALGITGALAGGLLGGMLGIRPTLFVAVAGYVLTPLVALFSPLRSLREIPEYEETAT
jgi:MFS family permease